VTSFSAATGRLVRQFSKSAENYFFVAGDFAQYAIVDRIGSTVEIVPHLFTTSHNRPIGQRGTLLWFRTGADSFVDNAFRLLDVR
jgi:HK97 family phage major capsid protein